jgi:hypothetical protein
VRGLNGDHATSKSKCSFNPKETCFGIILNQNENLETIGARKIRQGRELTSRDQDMPCVYNIKSPDLETGL